MMALRSALVHWPIGGLENVRHCPICTSRSRELLHDGLTDRVFFVAPGQWTLWRCDNCRSAYIDPRPTEATIGLAYSHYYTHEDGEPPEPRNALQRFRASLGNGYRNRRFGTRLKPALAIGGIIGKLLPPLAWPVNVTYRFLPRPAQGRQWRVLDIGCGSGAWLRLARDAGWQVAGVEPDPVSSQLARQHGIEVRASIGEWLDEESRFDFVTMSHVIEHVHDPLRLLGDSHKLLRPGGGIYIDTPNIDAAGHEANGRNWFALDPPRHLVLFNRDSLRRAVRQAGFRRTRYRARFYPVAVMSEQSRRIASGLDPYDGDLPASSWSLANLRSVFLKRQTEFLTLTAIKG